MTDIHKNPDIHMAEEPHKFETLLAGPKEDNRPVLGWTLKGALRDQRSEVVEAVKADPNSFLIAVITASGFKDRARGPAIVQHVALQNGLNFPRVFPAMPIGKSNNDFPPLPGPYAHFIPHCTPDTKKTALAKPVIYGVLDEELYTIYFINPTPEHLPFLILTYKGLFDLTTEPEIKSALITKLLSDPFVVTMANSDHTNVANETQPSIIFKVLVEFAKIRKYAVRVNQTKTTAFSIILPPLSTDASQTAILESHLMNCDFAFDVPFQGTATPWRNSKGELMACPECHSVAHYRGHCIIVNSDEYKNHYGQNSATDSSWYALNAENNDNFTSTSNSTYRGGGRGRVHHGFGHGSNRGRGGYARNFENGRGRAPPYMRH
ncbi:hypothetical protein B0H11DRAFT_2012730 [Mycena galericulata]|nr:hypothetical protein B0H11DRAFT_2012730 [Mycena galericulata]